MKYIYLKFHLQLNPKKKKKLGANLTKNMKDLHTESCKTLMKQTEQIERYPVLLGERILLKYAFYSN